MNTTRSALKPPSLPQVLPLLPSFHSGSSAALRTCARNSMRSWPSALVSPPADYSMLRPLYAVLALGSRQSSCRLHYAQTPVKGGQDIEKHAEVGNSFSNMANWDTRQRPPVTTVLGTSSI